VIRSFLSDLTRGNISPGYCNICQQPTLFRLLGSWHREQLRCMRCGSIARWRSLLYVLNQQLPHWKQLAIHESSPGGAVSEHLAKHAKHYSSSHYYPEVKPGSEHNGFRCENLEAMTFANESFDLFITQDVFEHLLQPELAIAEIARVLKPGGHHVFTIPWYGFDQSRKRVTINNGELEYLQPAEYHGNPIDPNGSLVITDWGQDLAAIISQHADMSLQVIASRNSIRGIYGEGLNVFISRKLDI